MSEAWWTWVLFAFEIFGITGMWYIGKKYWWGWLIVLTHSIPWFIYSLTYGKPGFIAMSFMWWTVNFINMMKWLNEKRVGPKDVRVTFQESPASDLVRSFPFDGQKNAGISSNVMPKRR